MTLKPAGGLKQDLAFLVAARRGLNKDVKESTALTALDYGVESGSAERGQGQTNGCGEPVYSDLGIK